MQALGLTPAQTAELEKIFAKSRPKLIDLKADLEKKQFAYEQAMSADKVDRADVEAKIEAREQARAKLQKELALMELDMKQVLTPEQREKAHAAARGGPPEADRSAAGRCAGRGQRPPAGKPAARPAPEPLSAQSRNRSSVHGSPCMWYPFSSQNPARSSRTSSKPLAHLAPFQK